jgi:hypothetical protein
MDSPEVAQVVVRQNLIAPWLRSNLRLTARLIEGRAPNTFLGIVPLGSKQLTQPVAHIASVGIDTGYNPTGVLVALIGVLVLLIYQGVGLVIGLLLVVIGAADSYQMTFKITDSGGSEQAIRVSLLDRGKLEQFIRKVNQQIADNH